MFFTLVNILLKTLNNYIKQPNIFTWTFHHITSHHIEETEAGLKGLYIREITTKFINTLLLIYNTPVSGASEISFIIKNYFLV